MSFVSLETPCRNSRAAPIGIISLTGQYCTPHSVNDTSPLPPGLMESIANLPLVQNKVPTKMKKNTDVNDVSDGSAARR